MFVELAQQNFYTQGLFEHYLKGSLSDWQTKSAQRSGQTLFIGKLMVSDSSPADSDKKIKTEAKSISTQNLERPDF